MHREHMPAFAHIAGYKHFATLQLLLNLIELSSLTRVKTSSALRSASSNNVI